LHQEEVKRSASPYILSWRRDSEFSFLGILVERWLRDTLLRLRIGQERIGRMTTKRRNVDF
jgi:hypothetical protein